VGEVCSRIHDNFQRPDLVGVRYEGLRNCKTVVAEAETLPVGTDSEFDASHDCK
jgi:hypothetical protein